LQSGIEEVESYADLKKVFPQEGARTVERKSLIEHSMKEIERHKWIESEKAGRDLGKDAINDWSRKHWRAYLRARWLEHVKGITFWKELERCNFGTLRRFYERNPLLLDRVLDRVMAGQENLDIILWAQRWGLNVQEVIDILESLDINSCRIQFPYE